MCPLSKDKPANQSLPTGVTINTMSIVTPDSTDWLAGLFLHPGGEGSSIGVAIGLGSKKNDIEI